MKLYIVKGGVFVNAKNEKIDLSSGEFDGVPVVDWTDICHSKDTYIFIHHNPYTYTSRHVSRENKRPYHTCIVYKGSTTASFDYPISRSATLEGAVKSARQYIRKATGE